MKVSIKDLSVDMDIKTKGIELDVYDNSGKHLGDLIVTSTGLTWCNGKTKRANGHKINWATFISTANSAATKPAKAAKPAKTPGVKKAAPPKPAKAAKAPKTQKAANPGTP